MDSPLPLVRLPAALVSLVYAYLPLHFKLRTCNHLNHSLSACLTPSCFQFDHLYLSPHLLHSLFASPRLATLLSAVSSLSVESEGATDKALLSLISRPPQASAISHPLSPITGTSLFPNLTFYSQRVDGIGFHPSSLSSFTPLRQLYVDTRRYDASIVLQLSPSFTHLHSLKLHALLSRAHLDALYELPVLTSLDLAGCTVLGGDIALHNMPLVSLLEPVAAGAVIGKLHTLLCPLGEQRVTDIVAIVKAQKEAVLAYLRCDDSPLSEQCIVDLLALPSLTALEIHSHNIRWEQPPFAALASSTSPRPSRSLQRLRFVADHDLRDRAQDSLDVIDSMSSFLSRFQHLHVLDFTLPSSIAFTDVLLQLLQLNALRRLSMARNKSGANAGHRSSADDVFDFGGILERSQSAFPHLHSLTCRRVMDMDESALMVLLSGMPALRVLQVSESSLVGAGAVLAAAAFCPQLRSIALIACSQWLLEDEHWRRSVKQLERFTNALISYGLHPPSTFGLPSLHFLSLQVFTGSVDRNALQRLVELLAGSPLHYFGLFFRIVAGVLSAPASPMLPLPLTAMLEPLPLIGLATPTPPLLRLPSIQSAPTHFEYSQQWVESEEAKARRERAVMVAERLSADVDSDEQLLYEWMTRHRYLQHDQYAHVFKSVVSRAGRGVTGKHAYFDDIRVESERERTGDDSTDVDETRVEGAEGTKESSEREAGSCCCLPLPILLSPICGICFGRR